MAPALRLDHVVLPVADIAASLRFYRDALGFGVLQALAGDDWGGYPWLMVLLDIGDGRQVVLVGFRGAPRPPADPWPEDSRHMAFAASGPVDLEAWRRRLDEHAVPWRAEDHGGQQSIYFADPDGLVLEITSPPSASTADAGAPAIIDAWLAGS